MFCGSVSGIPCEIISPKQVAQLHPLINIHDLVGAMYVPEDALVLSANVSLALATAASRNGASLTSFLSGVPRPGVPVSTEDQKLLVFMRLLFCKIRSFFPAWLNVLSHPESCFIRNTALRRSQIKLDVGGV